MRLDVALARATRDEGLTVAGRIIYLEVDDEITSRRRASGLRCAAAAVVLPYGSRVATSPDQLPVSVRDALTHDKRLSIVTGDPATRAAGCLGRPAGLRSVANTNRLDSRAGTTDWQAGARAAAAGRGSRARLGRRVAAAMTTPTRAAGAELAVETDLAVSSGAGGREPARHARRTRPAARGRTSVRAHTSTPIPRSAVAPPTQPTGRTTAGGRTGRAGSLGRRDPDALDIGRRDPGGRSSSRRRVYLLLPSARVVVTPRPEPVGPIQVTVVADPNTTAPDPVAGVVPAKVVSIPVAVDDMFAATGKRTELTRATGTVRFENRDPTSTNRIAAGSVVRTASGIRFRTNAALIVPRAELVGLTIFPARASVKVTAVDGGPEGNVEAGDDRDRPERRERPVPQGHQPGSDERRQPAGVQPRHPGRRRRRAGRPQPSLQAAFTEAMADPSLETGGATVFPRPGQLGEPTPSVAPETLVGQEVTTFALGLSRGGPSSPSTRRRSARSPRPQIQAQVEPGHELVPDRPRSTSVSRSSSARRSASRSRHRRADRVLDPEQLKAMVLGKRIDEATRILAPFGQVAMSVSPDWTGFCAELREPGHADDRSGCPDRDAGPSAPLDLARRDATGDQPSGELDPVTRLWGSTSANAASDLPSRRRRVGRATLSTLRRGRDLDADVKALAASSRRRDRCPDRRSAARGIRATRAPWPS
jgi:hypothetical protein